MVFPSVCLSHPFVFFFNKGNSHAGLESTLAEYELIWLVCRDSISIEWHIHRSWGLGLQYLLRGYISTHNRVWKGGVWSQMVPREIVTVKASKALVKDPGPWRNGLWIKRASQVAQEVKDLPANAGEAGSICGLQRFPGEGNGYPLQYSGLENSMDWGAWWASVHGVAKSRTWLSTHKMNKEGNTEASSNCEISGVERYNSDMT